MAIPAYPKTRSAVVIGTSNSLMREGWVNQLAPHAAAIGWQLVNKSIGGSSSRLGAYLIETGTSVRDADRIVVDFNINDQLFLDTGFCTQTDILSHYTTMLMVLHRHGQLDDLVVLLFPQQHVNNAMVEDLVRLLNRFHVTHIDFRPFLAKWCNKDGTPLAAAYSDPYHFTPKMQGRISSLVLGHLATQRKTTRKAKSARAWLLRQKPVGYCDMALSHDRLPVMMMGTSLIQNAVTRFNHADRCIARGAGLFVGAHVWATDQSGVLTIRGNGSDCRIHFRRDYKGLFIFDSLFTPLELTDATLVEAINDKKARFQRMRGQKSSVYPTESTTVELVSLIGAERAPASLGDDVRAYLLKPPKSVWQALKENLQRFVVRQ
jgi:hypothetical protein